MPKAGGASAQLLKSGQWHKSAFQLHLDLGRGSTQAMASISIEASDKGHWIARGPDSAAATRVDDRRFGIVPIPGRIPAEDHFGGVA